MAGTPLPLAQVEDFAKAHRCQPVSGFVTDEESSRAAPEYNDGPTKYGNANCTMVGAIARAVGDDGLSDWKATGTIVIFEILAIDGLTDATSVYLGRRLIDKGSPYSWSRLQ
jgi:hypothetical protein